MMDPPHEHRVRVGWAVGGGALPGETHETGSAPVLDLVLQCHREPERSRESIETHDDDEISPHEVRDHLPQCRSARTSAALELIHPEPGTREPFEDRGTLRLDPER
jgi:hypothetical protein